MISCVHPPNGQLTDAARLFLVRVCGDGLQSKLNETIARIQSVHDGHDDEDLGGGSGLGRRDTGERRPTVEACHVPRHFAGLVRACVLACMRRR